MKRVKRILVFTTLAFSMIFCSSLLTPNLIQAMDKVNKVMNAWTDLITNHTNPYTNALQVDIENFEFESQYYAVENKNLH